MIRTFLLSRLGQNIGRNRMFPNWACRKVRNIFLACCVPDGTLNTGYLFSTDIMSLMGQMVADPPLNCAKITKSFQFQKIFFPSPVSLLQKYIPKWNVLIETSSLTLQSINNTFDITNRFGC